MNDLLPNIKKYKLVLASQSPRRQELLGGLHLDFTVQIIDVEESYPEYLTGSEIPCYLAEKKANAYTIDNETLLITADTIVWHEGRVLGKPTDKADANRMLKQLSGKTHQVITGVCLRTSVKQIVFHVVSEVRFATLSDDEINFYLKNFQPYDKAGSYGVQEWIGYVGVEHIEGSYFNVMGLPIQRLYNELKNW